MNERRAILLVVERELREALRRRALWIAAGLALLASSAIMVVPALAGTSSDDYQVGVVGEPDQTLQRAIERTASSARLTVELVELDGQSEARGRVSDGTLDAALVLGGDARLVVEDESAQIVDVLRSAVAADRSIAQLREAGLDAQQVQAALSPPPLELEVLDEHSGDRLAVASVVALAMYLLIFFLTMQVANGVAIEKSNRVSEVLLAIVSPRSMLLGKVIGVGLTALVLLVAGALPVVIGLLASDSLPPGIGSAMGAASVWFVLCGAFYMMAAGALGALVERQEDTGSSVAGLTVLLVGSYIAAAAAPDTPLGAVLAVLPVSAVMVEPARIALGVSSPLEVAVSLLVCAVSVVIIGRVATAVYKRAVVRTGSKLRLREVLTPDP